MQLKIFAALLFFSLIFWIGNPANPVGWSFVEAIAAGMFLECLSRKDRLILPSNKIRRIFWLLVLWSTCSLFWTPNLHSTLTALYKIALCGLITILFLTEQEEWTKAVEASALIIGASGSVFWGGVSFRPSIPIPYPNLYAGFLSLCGVLAAGIFLREQSIKGKIAGLVFVLCGITVFISGALGAVLSFCAGTLYLLTVSFSVGEKRKLQIAAGVLAALAGLSILPIPNNPFRHFWLRRVSDAYAFERLAIWKDSLEIFWAKPFRGWGLGSFREIYPEFKSIPGLRNAPYAHNEPLNILCEMGLAGAILLFILAREIVSQSRGHPKNEALRPWIAVSAAALTQSMTDLNLRYEPVLLFFVLSLAANLRETEIFLITTKSRQWLSAAAGLLTIGFILPGAAYLLFFLRPQKAPVAKHLDPLNALYWSETGRMRDLEIAIALEPRNVWFRRRAAQFYFEDWQKTGSPYSAQEALRQYEKITKFAPNVKEFGDEMQNLKKNLHPLTR